MVRILLVEDDKSIIENLSVFLRREGYAVDFATGQKEATAKLDAGRYDLILLDVSLKDGNGFSVCSAVKAVSETPVIFLTASDDEYSVVAGFDVGADDYIGKPFRPRELLVRIRNVLRRSGSAGSLVGYGGISVDTQKGTAFKNGIEIYLSALEYRLLLFFLNNRGKVLSRSQLLGEIWDVAGEFVNDNTLTVYIKRLRDKIEDDPQQPAVIRTVRGLGYKLGE